MLPVPKPAIVVLSYDLALLVASKAVLLPPEPVKPNEASKPPKNGAKYASQGLRKGLCWHEHQVSP